MKNEMEKRNDLAEIFRTQYLLCLDLQQDTETPPLDLAAAQTEARAVLVILSGRLEAADLAYRQARAAELGGQAEELKRQAAAVNEEIYRAQARAHAAVVELYGPGAVDRLNLMSNLSLEEVAFGAQLLDLRERAEFLMKESQQIMAAPAPAQLWAEVDMDTLGPDSIIQLRASMVQAITN